MSPAGLDRDVERRVFAPGRVNLIGDHVDYVGGLVLPMAIDLGITIDYTAGGEQIDLRSADEPDAVSIPLPAPAASFGGPDWGRYVAAVAHELGSTVGLSGSISSTVPPGAGLSSSAALEVAVALALGADAADPLSLAQLCQRAEHRATGVPTGIMDQLAIVSGRAGEASLIDCRSLVVTPVPLPEGTVVHAVHSGVGRRLVGSEYADRRRQCEAAEREIGPLRDADLDGVAELADEAVRRRARHVVTEIARVRAAATATDPQQFGSLMNDSHASLRDDFEVSIPELDRLVSRLQATDGVHGARLTGAGFGGCAVALVDEDVDAAAVGGWRLRPASGAAVVR
ncbi:MAG: galactokinase [Acidimicrobiales bacterium]